jgi:hypothetical protein
MRIGLGHMAAELQLAVNFAGQDREMRGKRAIFLVGGGNQDGKGVRLDKGQSCGSIFYAIEFGDVHASSGSVTKS